MTCARFRPSCVSRTTAQVLTQNIALALGIKAVFTVLTFTGHATMWMAVFADMGASLGGGQWRGCCADELEIRAV